MKATRNKIPDSMHLIWIITSKDIVESLKNWLIISLILAMGFMLLMPKLLGLMLIPPETPVVVYDPGESRLTAELENSDQVQVQRARTVAEVEEVIGSMGFGLGPEFGLAIPDNFDQVLDAGNQPELDGYVAWANRGKASQLKTEFEEQLEEMVGQPVSINMEENIVYPPAESGLWLLMVTITPVIVIFVMGIQLVPTLLFEEKQSKTLDALLVSPASHNQVVAGKALAGLFYVMVAAGVVFAINWSGVVHWEMVLLFVLGIGLFSVGLGLLLGSFFERQQDVVGLTMALIVVAVAALFVDMLELDMPAAVQTLLPWVPTVALAEILRFVFLENVPWTEALLKLGSVLAISAVLYVVVVLKVRRSDR